MRILWVKADGLWPPNTGGRLRSFHILAELARRHQMTVATTHGPGEDPGALAAALPPGSRVVAVPHAPPRRGSVGFAAAALGARLSSQPLHYRRWRVPHLRRMVAGLIASGEIDLCVADFLKAMPNVPIPGPVPTILFAHNAEHVIWQRLSQVQTRRWRRAALAREGVRVRAWEAEACGTVRLTVAVSEADREVLAAINPCARIRAIPTGVDTAYFAPHPARETADRLVFTGSMDWHPNEDAMLYFIETILPLIRREVPGAALTIAGRNPSPRLRAAAAASGVHVTGTVEDVRPYVAEAAVYVIPLRVGGGTRLKLFEALAMGKAVVATTVGAEGLPLAPGRHFLRADAPGEFARAVTGLLRDQAGREALGAAGRRLVEEQFSWSHAASAFEACCAEVLEHHAD